MLKIKSLQDSNLIDLLKQGAVGIIPTDTVYGLVCSATDENAVARLYALKSRESKPGTIIAANIEQLVELGIKARYLKPVAGYWPNPISIEIPHSITYLNQGTGRQAFRIPADTALQKFLEKVGPLQTSSANNPGESEAKTITAAEDYFRDSVDFYVDGGNLSGRKASTIIRIVDDVVDVIREGAVIVNQNGEIQK
ncbi:L-threonylcarbamoyladenylate synthase [Candidatus Saccharibacteria bacterium]|nr:L-threonylcarbamoyladenylate synthase [Candidatus Saccharibacteria bacterium]